MNQTRSEHSHCANHTAASKAQAPGTQGNDRYICPMCPGVESVGPAACPKCGMALEPDRPPAPTATRYTCPMHPEVVSDHPGICPECGMALERDATGAQTPENSELTDMTRRFRVSALLAGPLLLIVMADMLPGQPVTGWLGHGPRGWLEWLLATPVCTWAAWPFYVRGWHSIRNRSLNMFSLIALGVGVAFGYSTVALILPELFPGSFRGSSGEVSLYFEAAGVIVTLILLGQVLEIKARSRTSEALQALLQLAPTTARKLTPCGHERDIPLEQVQAGDTLRVRPGEKVPVDGIVLEGHTHIDESMLTGESVPAFKGEGDSVAAATLNAEGGFLMRADKIGADTLYARIIDMVSAAQRSRAPVQRLADAVSAWFVPTVITIAAGAAVAWGLAGPEPRMAHAIIIAVSVLIIACPCALGLATPISVMTATARGASMGVLFRNAEAIETLRQVDTLLIDKTGTLTIGRPELVSLTPGTDGDERTLLQLAASLEQGSEHPLAHAILAGAETRGIELGKLNGFIAKAGKGVTGQVDGQSLALGNAALMIDLGLDSETWTTTAEKLASTGQTVVYLASDQAVLGLIGVADRIKDSTPPALARLRATGLEIIMVTGDNPTTALAVARQLGLDKFEAGVMPEQKVERVRQLQQSGHKVAMAGDGINDAPALALADVGIAMGTGTDVAMESADVTLVKGDLGHLADAHRLSTITMRNIRQNLWFAFLYNALGVPIAAGVLYPVFGVLLSPMIAAGAMSLSSVSVITNALRLRKLPLG